MDIFCIIETVEEFYTTKMDIKFLKKCWVLLLVAAISGALPSDFNNDLNPAFADKPSLGIARSESDFVHYGAVLNILKNKFKSDTGFYDKLVGDFRIE